MDEFMKRIRPNKPITPYAETSGWSGSETSKDRAIKTDRPQLIILNLIKVKEQGLTWHEVDDLNNWHHGQASKVLSVLHKEGIIARLKERRNGSAVYVLLSERKVKTCKNCGAKL